MRGDIVDRNGVVLATTGYPRHAGGLPRPDSIDGAQPDDREADRRSSELDDGQRSDLLDSKLSQTTHYAVHRARADRRPEHARCVRASRTASCAGWAWCRSGAALPQHRRPTRHDAGEPAARASSPRDGTGRYGIEQQYNTILAGKTQASWRPPATAVGRYAELRRRCVDPGADGEDISLTIDASLQLQLEKELYAAWVADKAQARQRRGDGPRTGEVLAWASVPGYDANNYAATGDRRDPSCSGPDRQPGLRAGLGHEDVHGGGGTRERRRHAESPVQDRRRHHVRVHRWSTTATTSAWAGSRSGTRRLLAQRGRVAKVAARLGRTTTRARRDALRDVAEAGYRQPTGIDVAGRGGGHRAGPRPPPWQPIDLANRAFGQWVAVTPIQLADGVRDDGQRRATRPAALLVAIDGRTQTVAPRPPGARPEARRAQLKGILEHVTAGVPWYAEGTLIPGYQVGGKTGTAQIWDATHKVATTRTTSTSRFVGFVGGDAPRPWSRCASTTRVPASRARATSSSSITLVPAVPADRADAIIRAQDVPKASDPNAGQPEPGSGAETGPCEPRSGTHRRTHQPRRAPPRRQRRRWPACDNGRRS